MNQIAVEQLLQDKEEHPYHKELKEKIRKKAEKAESLEKADKIVAVQEQVVEDTDKKRKKEDKIKNDKHDFEDKIELSRLDWDKDGREQDSKKQEEKGKEAQGILEFLKRSPFLHQKIDFKQKEMEIKEGFKHAISRRSSHNQFYAKFSFFKSGVLQYLMSVIGVSRDEVEKLRKEATEEAVQENKDKMAETIYSYELLVLMGGIKRKNRAHRQLLLRTQRILSIEMENSMGEEYWTLERILEEKIKQSKRIKEELIAERGTINYQRNYILQNELGGGRDEK